VALLYVQEILRVGLDLLDDGVTLFTVSASGLCLLSLFLISEECSESKDTKVLNMYNIFNLQKRHCERITSK